MRTNSIQQESATQLISSISVYILLNMGMFFWSMPRHRPRGYVSHRPKRLII